MKSLKDTLSQKRSLSAAEKDAIAEKIHDTPPLSKTIITDVKEVTQEKALHRLTLDLPLWLVEKMKTETSRNGQTMKGLVLTMLLDRFKE